MIIKQPASSLAAGDQVADLVSSRTGARGLSPLLEKDEEDEGWVGKGIPDLGQKTTSVKAFPLGTFGGSMVSEGHRDISPPKVTGFGTLGWPNTFGEAGTSKQTSKIRLGDRPDSPKSSISIGAVPTELRIRQLKMDLPPVFTASRQQNVRGWLTKME